MKKQVSGWLAAMSLVCAGTMLQADELLGEWKFSGDPGKSGFFCYPTAKGVKAKHDYDGKVITPVGEGAYRVEVIENGGKGKYNLQFGVLYKAGLKGGESYRITLVFKGQDAVKFPVAALLFGTPWTTFGEAVAEGLPGEWQQLVLSFKMKLDCDKTVATPIALLGQLPVGSVVYFASAKLERVEVPAAEK